MDLAKAKSRFRRGLQKPWLSGVQECGCWLEDHHPCFPIISFSKSVVNFLRKRINQMGWAINILPKVWCPKAFHEISFTSLKGISLFPAAVRDLCTCLFVFSCYNVSFSFSNFLEITKMNYFLFLNHHGPGQSSSTFPFRNTRHALLNSTVIFLYNF